MKLSPRLAAIVRMIDLPTKVADVGTDHAYIPIYLAQNTSCSTIIASDAKENPYQFAIENVKQMGLADRIDVRLGSGLSVLNEGEVETVIIAGMGSQTMQDIITADYELAQNLERIILQPMAGAASLRKWLVKNNFKIIDESLVKDERIYQIIVVEPGSMELNDQFLLELGPILIQKREELWEEYTTELINKWNRIKNEIIENNPEHAKVAELNEKIKKIKEIKGIKK
ncbi:class I SAM-dependent methyltransferase [Natroniella sulfidigena]|uniref:tRNA (adenine(22)-N(1))-methyltransferase n=1 Tax=Natroniella sulfidigena TaxID=723921 RepID=UPI00200A77C5|nr:class I SAM-dependent methyltransferase [Natroniella sulfidigena]MCK8815949.1 class I SAM-dependent methyltransferase [Natroniella sulfidigena]